MVRLFKLRFLNLHQRLDVYIGAQYTWNKVILVEVLQTYKDQMFKLKY